MRLSRFLLSMIPQHRRRPRDFNNNDSGLNVMHNWEKLK